MCSIYDPRITGQTTLETSQEVRAGIDGGPGITLNVSIYSASVLQYMNGNGSQKSARLERLKVEITEYVASNPGCSAADIVNHLSNNLRMRNHGLTSRKVGFFIPRYLKNIVMFTLDRSTGKRIYNVA